MIFSENMATEDIVNFQSSKLGTKEYWDSCYELENQNFDCDGDVGEVWFGEEASGRILGWLEDRCEEGQLSQAVPVVDVGCGNGVLSIDLSQAGWEDVTGLDYSPGAVELARKIAGQEESQGQGQLTFATLDILDSQLVSAQYGGRFKVVIDKGTFDAVSLSESSEGDRERYRASVAAILQTGGIFLITSCNWTESELIKHFSPAFSHLETVPTPTFSFGGKTGKTTTFCIFNKN